MVDELTFDNIWRRAAAGAMSVPATPVYMYGLANMGARRFLNTELPGGAYAERASQTIDRGIHDLLGIQPPQSTADLALEAAGNVLVAPPRALVAAAPLADRLLRSVFVTPRSIPGRAFDAGAQTAIGSIALNAAAPSADDGTLSTPPSAATAPPPASSPMPLIDDVLGTPSASPGARTQAASPDLLANVLGETPAPPPDPQRDEPLSWHDTLIAGALAVGGVAAMQTIARGLRSAPVRTQSALTGTMPDVASVVQSGERITTALQDNTAALRGTYQRSGAPNAADFNNRVVLDFNPQALAQRVKDFWDTGVLDPNIRTAASPRALTESVGALPEAERAAWRDYMMGRNELDNIAAGTRARPDVPEADLRALVQAGDNNPTFVRLRDEYTNITQTLARYANQRGLIDTQTMNDLITRRPGYMPQIVQTERPGLFSRLADIATADDREALQNFRHFFERSAQAPGTKFAGPIEALEQYAGLLVRTANLNSTRLHYLNGMSQAPTAWARDVVRELRTPPRGNPDNVIKVWDGGVERRFQVNDPVLLTTLRNIPQHVGVIEGAANVMRRGAQFGATGLGNPAFAPRSGMYDAIAASILHPPGTRFGFFPGDVVGGIAGSVVGAGRGLYGHATRTLAHALEDSWRNNGTIAGVLGQSATRQLADRMANAWMRSTLHSMEQTGALSAGRFTNDPNVRNTFTMLDASNPNYASRVPLLRKAWEQYRTVLELISSGARIHFYATNFGRSDARTLARQTRQLVGDPSARGQSASVRAFTNFVPYSNITIQSMAALGKSLRTNPMTVPRLMMALGVPAAFSVWNAMRLGPEYVDHMFRRQTSDQQTTFLPLYLDGHAPEDAPMIAIPGELRAPYAMLRDGFAAMLGATSEVNNARMLDNFGTSLMSGALPLSPPPILAAGANLMGYEMRGGYGGNVMSMNQMQGGGRLNGESPYNRMLPPDAPFYERFAEHNLTGALLGTMFGTAGQALVEATRAALQSERGGASPRQAVNDGLTTIDMQMQRTLPMLNGVVWNASQRVATQNLDARMLGQKEAALRLVRDQFNTNVQTPGAVGSRMHPQRMDGLDSVDGVRDLSMVPIMSQIADFANRVQRADNAEIARIRDRMTGIQSAEGLTPRQREQQRNVAAREMMEAQRRLLERIVDFEGRLSQQYGRRIRLEDVTRAARLNDLPPLSTPAPIQ